MQTKIWPAVEFSLLHSVSFSSCQMTSDIQSFALFVRARLSSNWEYSTWYYCVISTGEKRDTWFGPNTVLKRKDSVRNLWIVKFLLVFPSIKKLTKGREWQVCLIARNKIDRNFQLSFQFPHCLVGVLLVLSEDSLWRVYTVQWILRQLVYGKETTWTQYHF